jgi:nitrogen fixation NifU-like protein
MPHNVKILDHLNNPRNVGALDKNDPQVGIGIVGTPESGCVMKLYLKVDPTTRRIEAATFKTFGCSAAIASCSLVTEWMQGRTLAQALEIQSAAIAEELALPPDKQYCADMAAEAIQAAARDFERKHAGH